MLSVVIIVIISKYCMSQHSHVTLSIELSDFKRDFFCHYEQLWFSYDDFAKILTLQKEYQKELLYKYVSDFQVINAKLGKKWRNPNEKPRDFPGGSVAKNPPAMQGMLELWIRSLGQEDPLEEGMATHCNILAWRTPWTKERGKLQSMGLQRVGHD